jgi:Flp pilus assembly protein TadB
MKAMKWGAVVLALGLAASSWAYAQDKKANQPQKVEKAAGKNAPAKASTGTAQRLDAAVTELNDKLKLTPDQQKKIDDLVKAAQANTEKSKQSLAGDMKKIQESVKKEVGNLGASVEKILNDTQKAEFKKMRDAWQQKLNERFSGASSSK